MAERARNSFEESAVQRAVLRTTTGHPLSVYPTVLAALGGMAALLFGSTTFLLAGVSGAAALGLGSWLINYFFRRESFAAAYLRRAHEALQRETERKLDHLREELDELGIRQGVVQIPKFREKLDTLKTVLLHKLDESELTYGRYLGIAEQVYLAAVDNLHEAALASRSVRAIDLAYIDRRIREIEADPDSPADDLEEAESLRERRRLASSQTARISELLSLNESAMTTLDRTTAAIARIKTRPGHASVDFETAMNELARLARNAHRYSSE